MTKNKESLENINRRGREFYARMKKKGYVVLHLWVPVAFKERVKKFVKGLKDKWWLVMIAD